MIEEAKTEAAAVMYNQALQEKEFSKALRNERRRGEARGEKRGEARGEIKGVVKTYSRIGRQPSEIAALLMEEYGLKSDEARKAVAEVLGPEPA